MSLNICYLVTFEVRCGGAVAAVWWACTVAVGLAILGQLSGDQGITPRWSTNIVPEFFSLGIHRVAFIHLRPLSVEMWTHLACNH